MKIVPVKMTTDSIKMLISCLLHIGYVQINWTH